MNSLFRRLFLYHSTQRRRASDDGLTESFAAVLDRDRASVRTRRPKARNTGLAAVFWALCPADGVAQGSVDTDRAALEVLYDATGGPGWTNAINWKSDAPLGDWYGVITDDHGRVVRLSLYDNGLVGSIPSTLGALAHLEHLGLTSNASLTGPIPATLGKLVRLRHLHLWGSDLTGRVPDELGNLVNLASLYLAGNWGLSGPLPQGLRRLPLWNLDVFLTQTCAPVDWRNWLKTFYFEGRLCETGTDVTVDVAVVYTPAARLAAGGVTAIQAEIDLRIAEANSILAASGVDHRLAVAASSEVAYVESGFAGLDVSRLADPADGHMDEVHVLRDRVMADLVHLIVDGRKIDVSGWGQIRSAFSLTSVQTDGETFAHELGHNLGLRHDRYQVDRHESGPVSHPGHGYVNQRAFAADAPPSSRWMTLMAYRRQCSDAGISCRSLPRFSNPRQRYAGDPMGIAYGAPLDDTGPADASAVLTAVMPAAAEWGDPTTRGNRPPVAVGTLADRRLDLDDALEVDVSQAFFDPDGDYLTYDVSSTAPHVVAVAMARTRVRTRLTLTAVGVGASRVQVTATDFDGLGTTQSFTVWVAVDPPANRPPVAVGTLAPLKIGVDNGPVTVEVASAFRDPDGDALTYAATSSSPSVAVAAVLGNNVTVTPVGTGTATVRVTATDAEGSNTTASQSFAATVVAPFTDHPIVPRETPVRAVHFGELRSRIDRLRTHAGLAAYDWTDPVLRAGVTPVRLVHLLEMRSALAGAYAAAGREAPSWSDAATVARETPIQAVHLMELRAAVVELELSRRPPTPGKISESAAPSECALMPSSTATAASDNGTRCSPPPSSAKPARATPATQGRPRPTFAPRTSSDRTAVSAVKRTGHGPRRRVISYCCTANPVCLDRC